MVAQAVIDLFLPAINGIGLQAVRAAQLGDRCAGLPLLKDIELLLCGDTTTASTFNRSILVHLHRLNRPFKLSKSQLGRPIVKYLVNSNETANEKERLLAVQQEELQRIKKGIQRTYDLYQQEKLDADGFSKFYTPLEECRK